MTIIRAVLITVIGVLTAQGAFSQVKTYIIPVYADQLTGSDAEYSSTIALTNNTAAPAVVRLVAAYRASEGSCLDCDRVPFVYETVEPYSRAVRGWPIGLVPETGLAALVLEAPEGVDVESFVVRHTSDTGQVQAVEIAEHFLAENTQGILYDALDEVNSTNLFLVNSSDRPGHFEYRSRSSLGGLGTAEVRARSIAMVTLPPSFACGAHCVRLDHAAGDATDLIVTANVRYTAATSTRSKPTPAAVRVARPSAVLPN